MHKSLINSLTAIFLGIATLSASARELPKAWRLPTQKELSYFERNDSPSKYARVVADFNGDGIDDEALLLKSTGFSGEALWIYLSTGTNTAQWFKLNEIKWGPQYPEVDLAMGIDVAAPGVHEYACFEGAKDCNFNRPRPKLKLRDPSLRYFKFGSAASLYFWSNKSNKFLRVWVSD